MELEAKSRFVRLLPGRIRIEIAGLKGSAAAARILAGRFSNVAGVRLVEACAATGRALIVYDERLADSEAILGAIREAERAIALPADVQRENALPADVERATALPAEAKPSAPPERANEPEAIQGDREAAASAEPLTERQLRTELDPVRKPPPVSDPKNRVPLPLAAAIGGLTILGAKRLFTGTSAWSQSPLPFYMSGLVSVVTGYPFLRRGFDTLTRHKKWNSDLLLGTSALALALVRENLLVLAGLSILQYVNWRRSRLAPSNETEEELLSPKIQSYSEKAARWGLIGGAVTWAVTRDPLRGIAVMLAANPRPATAPAQLAWRKAEVVSRELNYAIPQQGSLPQLARTNTILVEDASLLFEAEDPPDKLLCITNEEDADKAVCVAASLMKNADHPWREDVWDQARKTCRTIRSAFHVTMEDGGLSGKINDRLAYVGSAEFLSRHGISCDAYSLEAKRKARKGYDVLFVAMAGHKPEPCVGFIARKERRVLNEHGKQLRSLPGSDWRIAALRNRSDIEDAALSENGVDARWLSLEPGEVIERVAVLRKQGESALFVAGSEPSPLSEYLAASGIPTIRPEEIGQIAASAEYAREIDRTVHRQLQVTKSWNLFGSALASLGAISAPLANLAADALSLVFISRAGKTSRAVSREASSAPLGSAPEIAAAAERPVWHSCSCEDATGHFRVSRETGLARERWAELRALHGPNALEGKRPKPWIATYAAQFKEFTTLVLLGTTAFAFFGGGVVDGLAMGAILLANAAIGAVQERKAEKVVEALNRYQPPQCKVLRDSRELTISAEELVPGDIVLLEAGDRVPADIKLLQSSNLRVSEAALTGESLPVEKNALPVEASAPLTERTDMLYMGTDVCGGNGTGIVVHTGMDTEMGRLVSLLKHDDKEVTPLQRKVTSISKMFVKGALAAGAIVFVTGLLRGVPVTQMISTSIALASSAIPEGLPVTITIALSAGIFRMAKKNALVRKLSALETLGRTTVICTDKTGTLTKNEMTVRAVATVTRAWAVTGDGYEPSGDIREMGEEVASGALAEQGEGEASVAAVTSAITSAVTSAVADPELRRILEIGILCNNSKLERRDGKWVVNGDPTEGALFSLAAKNGLRAEEMNGWHRSLEVPFDSSTGKMSVVCKETQQDKDCYVFTKGAVEAVLRRCSRYQKNGELFPLGEEEKRLILEQNEKFSAEALRVLAFAYRPIESESEEAGIDEQDLIYVGLVGMSDPPKPEVENGIRQALALGVKPVMITGDHPITAVSIARQLGIYDGTQKVVSGHELDRMSDEELFGIVDDVSIFARVTPEHKLRIVTAYQSRGHIVAMTGDGVNDSPAIKQADVGIAMGESGTEVTKEAADIVLQQDHFGSIVEGVKEGRTIIGNIRKALGCLLTGNLAEIIVTSAAVMLGLPVPLIPVQILLMNLLTDALPAIVLAVNPGNDGSKGLPASTDIADRPLYRKVATRGALLGLGSLGLYAASLAMGTPLAVAQSIAFATLVTGQLFQTFSWRREGEERGRPGGWREDRLLLGALGVSGAALLVALYIPALSGFLHTAPLTLRQWLPVLAVAGSVSLLSKPLLALVSGPAPARPEADISAAAA